MAFWKRETASDSEQETTPEPLPEVTGVRSQGPWDVTERPGDGEGYVDLGALRVKVPHGFSLQMPADKRTGEVVSVVVVGANGEGGLDLRAFAAPRSGGLWEGVRADLAAEVERREGQQEVVEGPFGPELRFRVPATLPSGETGFQPSRVIGIDGPRWMLRATFLGQAAIEPRDDGALFEALRDVVVVRGDVARPSREALLLTLPKGAISAQEAGDGAPSDDSTPT